MSEEPTPRERLLLRLLNSDSAIRELAKRLGVPEGTIRTHLRRIQRTLRHPDQNPQGPPSGS